MDIMRTSCPDNFYIGHKSDALDAFERIMESIEGNGDMSGYVETSCGEGRIIDCLYAIKDALERDII